MSRPDAQLSEPMRETLDYIVQWDPYMGALYTFDFDMRTLLALERRGLVKRLVGAWITPTAAGCAAMGRPFKPIPAPPRDEQPGEGE